MRNWHYWKKAGAASAPQSILVFDTETWHGDYAKVVGGECHKLRLGNARTYRLRHGRRSGERCYNFTDPDQFWGVVKLHLDARRTLWIFAHNAAYDIGSVRGWNVILGNRMAIDQAILTQTMLFIRGQLDGCPVVFCDTCNYYHCPLASVGKAVGIPKMQMPEQSESDFAWLRYCKNDVDITAAGIDALIEFNRKNELGPWGPSIASLSFNAYRHRFMEKKVLVHCDWQTIRLERQGYCGGITDCNFVGRVPFSPVHELDVNSMYGAQCLRTLPYRRISNSYKVGPNKLRACPADQMVIAEVTIEHDTERFPCKTPKGTVYPVGRYRTVLAHPELMAALEVGAVKWVHQAAWYACAPIFKEYMDTFGEMKVRYARDGNDAFTTLAKYYITNLYGKTGQTTPAWKRWGEESLREIERQYGYKPGALEPRYKDIPRVKCLCGTMEYARGNMCQQCLYQISGIEQERWHDGFGNFHWIRDWFGYIEIKGERYESRDSCPAIAATVTSYARILLRQIQRTAGYRDWCYSDTDSIWVSDDGLRRIRKAGLLRTGVFGHLDYKGSHDWMIVHGPKDYVVPGKVKLKGVKPLDKSYIQEGDEAFAIKVGEKTLYLIRTAQGEYRQTQFPSASVQIKEGMTDGIKVKHITKSLTRTLDKQVVGPDGWTRPLRFPEERP